MVGDRVMTTNSTALKRQQFLALALRRARRGSGSTGESLTTRTWRSPVVSLGIDRDLLRSRVPSVIVGGVATVLHMPQRMTLDLDVLVVADDAPAFHRELLQAGCARLGSPTIGGTSWRTPGGSTLDVPESREPWAGIAIHHPNSSPTGEPVIALPYLVLLKLAASHPRDIADLSRMLGAADDATLDAVRRAVQRYRGADRDDLESLIVPGKLEFTAEQERGKD